MNRRLAYLVTIGSAAILVTACQKATGQGSVANDAASAMINQAVPPTPPPVASKAVNVESKDDVLKFRYSWPSQAARIAALDQWLRANMDYHRKRMTVQAKRDAKAAKVDGYEFPPYSFDENWKTTADIPALLVMQAEGGANTGGAHGMPFTATLIWDKAKAQRLATKALLDVAILARVAKPDFCKALDAQRAEKRGAPVDPAEDNLIPAFVQCVPLEKQEIVPLSSNGKSIDGLRIMILPYEAGPYAEGSYVIDLPMNAALMSAVKPAWKSAFAPK